ncbi:MAG: diguanylate cyclase [Treponema sp.]|jgi:diguanylate cyclase (GGDEF)-like protein|nr:diguanylate cyclase [Treponema sp.]
MAQTPQSDAFDLSPIEKVELFSSLLDKELAFVRERSGFLQLRRGARLFSQGERAEHFYLLITGAVRVFKPRPGGDDDEIAEFASGDTIGDFDFARRAEYDACAEAAEDAALIMFPGYGLNMDRFVLEAPQTASRIFLGAILMTTARIKSTQRLILENLSWVQELHRRAYEDPGTGLWKQSFLTDEINHILETPTALIMLKPDRFKVLVDSRGHGAGDEAMVRIAIILKNSSRRIGRGWPLRFKSNEVGVLINRCGASQAGTVAEELSASIAALSPVPAQKDIPAFSFSCTVSYAVWPEDESVWDTLFQNTYTRLLDTWRAGGSTIVRCRGHEK